LKPRKTLENTTFLRVFFLLKNEGIMKTIHKILLLIFVIEVFTVRLLGEMGLWVNTLWVDAIGAFFVFLPIWLIVILSIKDPMASKNKKIVLSSIGLFIFIAYVLGIISKICF
jgi:hypothetical protein